MAEMELKHILLEFARGAIMSAQELKSSCRTMLQRHSTPQKDGSRKMKADIYEAVEDDTKIPVATFTQTTPGGPRLKELELEMDLTTSLDVTKRKIFIHPGKGILRGSKIKIRAVYDHEEAAEGSEKIRDFLNNHHESPTSPAKTSKAQGSNNGNK